MYVLQHPTSHERQRCPIDGKKIIYYLLSLGYFRIITPTCKILLKPSRAVSSHVRHTRQCTLTDISAWFIHLVFLPSRRVCTQPAFLAVAARCPDSRLAPRGAGGNTTTITHPRSSPAARVSAQQRYQHRRPRARDKGKISAAGRSEPSSAIRLAADSYSRRRAEPGTRWRGRGAEGEISERRVPDQHRTRRVVIWTDIRTRKYYYVLTRRVTACRLIIVVTRRN